MVNRKRAAVVILAAMAAGFCLAILPLSLIGTYLAGMVVIAVLVAVGLLWTDEITLADLREDWRQRKGKS